MKLDVVLKWTGIVAAVVATITAAIALDNGKLNPMASLALGVAALALFKGSERS